MHGIKLLGVNKPQTIEIDEIQNENVEKFL